MAIYEVKFIVRSGIGADRIKQQLERVLDIDGNGTGGKGILKWWDDTTKATVTKVERNKTRAQRLDEAEALVQDALSIVEELQGEMQDWYENLPEGLQQSGKGDLIQEAADNLQGIMDALGQCEFGDVNFPGMFDN